jgi:hypothetical protein
MNYGPKLYNPVDEMIKESCAAAEAADMPFSKDLPAEITPKETVKAEEGAAK